MTKFDGHILEGAILQKTSSSNGFEVKLLPGGSLIEYWPGKPDDHWSGEWRVTDHGTLILQVGQYRSIYEPYRRRSNNSYYGTEDGHGMEIYFLKDGDSWLDRLGSLFGSGSSPSQPSPAPSGSSGDWRTKAAEFHQSEVAKAEAKKKQEQEERVRQWRLESAQINAREEAKRQEEARSFRKWQEPYRCHVCGELRAEPYKVSTPGHMVTYNESSGGGTRIVWNLPQKVKKCRFCQKWTCENCEQDGICSSCA